MISERCELSDFIQQIDNNDIPAIIMKAQDETTEAERYYLRHKIKQNLALEQTHIYAEQLKMLISFLRYGVRASGLPKDAVDILKSRIVR
jgi:hypothetical protein